MSTSGTRSWCSVTTRLRLEFRNSTGRLNNEQFQALVAGWETAIENLWNGLRGHQEWRCCSVSFDVITRIGSGTSGFHQVNVVAGPQTSTAGLGPDSVSANWDDLDNGNVVAHEAGHLMGLPDEYDYGGPGGSYRNLNPQSSDPQSIMAQTWGNVAALQEHIDQIMDILGIGCPWWCCILRWIRRFWRLFGPRG